jgi:hypothetical protein
VTQKQVNTPWGEFSKIDGVWIGRSKLIATLLEELLLDELHDRDVDALVGQLRARGLDVMVRQTWDHLQWIVEVGDEAGTACFEGPSLAECLREALR